MGSFRIWLENVCNLFPICFRPKHIIFGECRLLKCCLGSSPVNTSVSCLIFFQICTKMEKELQQPRGKTCAAAPLPAYRFLAIES